MRDRPDLLHRLVWLVEIPDRNEIPAHRPARAKGHALGGQQVQILIRPIYPPKKRDPKEDNCEKLDKTYKAVGNVRFKKGLADVHLRVEVRVFYPAVNTCNHTCNEQSDVYFQQNDQ